MRDHYKFMLASELFPMINRESESGRVFLQAIEALAFSHPHKKFYYRVRADRIGEESKLKNLKLSVMDYGSRVCTISTFRPDGEHRNKFQVQFEYDYEVHQKEPRNLKRSSDYKKILDYAKLVRPFDHTTKGAMVNVFHSVGETLSNVTKLRDGATKVSRLFSNLHYGGNVEKLTFYNIICGNINPETEKMRAAFVEAYSDYNACLLRYNTLMNKVAVVVPTAHGEYRVVRRQYKGRGDRSEDITSYDYESKIYQNKDSLPEDLTGKMAVLEILPSDSSISEVDDVGIFDSRHMVYTIIGEDLNGIDAREEGQTSGV